MPGRVAALEEVRKFGTPLLSFIFTRLFFAPLCLILGYRPYEICMMGYFLCFFVYLKCFIFGEKVLKMEFCFLSNVSVGILIRI